MLTDKEIQTIKDHQAQSIKHRALVKEQLEMIYASNWFNIWVPTLYKGKGLSLVDGCALLEELAYWDGGLAWTVTLCAGANMFAGYIDPKIAQTVFSDPKVCLGGSGRVGGKAVWDGEKYTISGVWQFATGAPHLTHFTLNCFIYYGDEQQVDAGGNPLVYSFFVPKDKVLIHYDWDTFGLECTASHSFSLENVKVEANYSFQIKPEHGQVDEPLFRIPFMPFAEVTLLVNYIGMYRRFLDLVEKYFFDKSKDSFWESTYSKQRFKLVDEYQVGLAEDRKKTTGLIAALWDKNIVSPMAEDDPLLQEIASFSRSVVKGIRERVVQLFPLVGISGAQRENELNIVFRNIFTATQHSLLNIS